MKITRLCRPQPGPVPTFRQTRLASACGLLLAGVAAAHAQDAAPAPLVAASAVPTPLPIRPSAAASSPRLKRSGTEAGLDIKQTLVGFSGPPMALLAKGPQGAMGAADRRWG